MAASPLTRFSAVSGFRMFYACFSSFELFVSIVLYLMIELFSSLLSIEV